MLYSPRFERAVVTALEAHGLARRKAGRGFEISHVVSVAAIVADFGFPEDAVVAAILHDTLEDTDLDASVIEERFGPLVLATVRDLSEPPKPMDWRTRKEIYIDQIRSSPRMETRAVASADKIHNLSKMTQGVQTSGLTFLSQFTSSLESMLWYQEAVLGTLRAAWSHPILDEHTRRWQAFRDAAEPLRRANTSDPKVV